MAKLIRDIFEEESNGLKIDGRLVRKLIKYVAQFTNKTDESLQFLGSPLVGVYPFRFSRMDSNELFDDILEMDDLTLKTKIKEHFKDPTNVDLSENWKISSNVTNLALVWLTYKIITSTSLSKRDKASGTNATITMLQYKFISSLDYQFFKYPANKEIAQAVYSSLTKRFSLKRHGSWGALVASRTRDILDDKGIHSNAIRTMSSDHAIVYLINDSQGRYKDIYKRITTLFYEFREQDSKIQSVSATLELAGAVTIKDKTNNYSRFRVSAHEITATPSSFIRQRALDGILKVVHTAPPESVRESLEWLSSNYGARSAPYIKEFVEIVITHACEFIRKNELPLSDPATILIKIRGIHLAPRQSESSVLKIRELGTKITDESVKSKNIAVHASVRAAITLYIILRILAKDNL